MLKISSRQRAAFRDDLVQRFEYQMCEHLRRDFPRARDASDAALARWIRGATHTATACGIVKGYDVRRFLEHCMSRGRGFIGIAPFAAILRDASLDGTRKMDIVDELDLFAEGPWRNG